MEPGGILKYRKISIGITKVKKQFVGESKIGLRGSIWNRIITNEGRFLKNVLIFEIIRGADAQISLFKVR
jgi:hypothetical protein